jgi:hypothetical protein
MSALDARVASEVAKATGSNLLDYMVPESGVSTDDVLTVTFHADGKRIEVHKQCAKEACDEVKEVVSGGEGGVWQGFQKIFLGEDPLYPLIKIGIVEKLPNILAGAQATGTLKKLTTKDLESLDIGSKRSWAKYAGRKQGAEGYKFGDLTRHLLHKVKPAPAVVEESSSSVWLSLDALAREEELERLRTDVQSISSELRETKRCLDDQWDKSKGIGIGLAACSSMVILDMVLGDQFGRYAHLLIVVVLALWMIRVTPKESPKKKQ